MIALGERRELDFDLAVEAVGEVVKVTAEADPLISPDRMESASDPQCESAKKTSRFTRTSYKFPPTFRPCRKNQAFAKAEKRGGAR
jgi:hypothetical protein